MNYGMHIFATTDSIQPDELGREAEERGFDSVWFSEHTHIPIAFLHSEGGQELPDFYWQAYDPFIAATQAATATKRIKVGTGISLFLQHDAIALAKTVATVDQVSGGRFVFGVGTGWNREEMENHGIPYAKRYRIGAEYIQAMKALWTEDEPEFQGKYVNFSRSKALPKPAQSPHPALISGGGAGPKSLDFMARHCDGWMPILGYPDVEGIKKALPKLWQLADSHGRGTDTIELSAFSWEIPDETTASELEELGCESINIALGAKNRDEALKTMDQAAELM